MNQMAECILYGISRFVDYYEEDGMSNTTLSLLELHMKIHSEEINLAMKCLFTVDSQGGLL